MRFVEKQIISNGDMSANVYSIGIEVQQLAFVSIQAVWTGTPTGTLKLQISDDIVPVSPSSSNPVGADPGANVVNWSDYTVSVLSITGSNGNFTWKDSGVSYRWVRLAYIKGSSSGTLNATLAGKG